MLNKANTYGKVENGRVVEFPVTTEIILARGHRLHQYSPVVFEDKPAYDPRYQKLTTTLSVANGRILVKQVASNMTTAELLAALKNADGTVAKIGDLSPAVVSIIKTSVANYVESRISALCLARGYSSIDRVLGGYANSSEPSFKADAEFIQTVIDRAWRNLIPYFASLEAGAAELPTTLEEILKISEIPTSWPT